MFHDSVLKKEVLEGLNLKDGDIYLDCTAGLGGHVETVLNYYKNIKVIAIDKDPENYKFLEDKFKNKDNVYINLSDYKYLDNVLSFHNIKKVNGVLFDLGYCSTHVDDSSRGFSFKKDGPLDMRYDRNQTLTAEDVVNNYSFADLKRIFKEYGEERFSKNIALEIIKFRETKKISSTLELKKIILKSIPLKFQSKKKDPATKVFQAIRIEVNSEFKSLIMALNKVIDLLESGGRLCVISFHSLEDRIVKNIFKDALNPCSCPKDLPQCLCGLKPKIKIVNRTPLTASDLEVKSNVRSRSAKLRIIEKI